MPAKGTQLSRGTVAGGDTWKAIWSPRAAYQVSVTTAQPEGGGWGGRKSGRAKRHLSQQEQAGARSYENQRALGWGRGWEKVCSASLEAQEPGLACSCLNSSNRKDPGPRHRDDWALVNRASFEHNFCNFKFSECKFSLLCPPSPRG